MKVVPCDIDTFMTDNFIIFETENKIICETSYVPG